MGGYNKINATRLDLGYKNVYISFVKFHFVLKFDDVQIEFPNDQLKSNLARTTKNGWLYLCDLMTGKFSQNETIVDS